MASKKKNFLKIVILGDSGVGKTSLLQQYVQSKVNQATKPTIGADFSKKEVIIDNTVVTLQIWDTAGQEKFQSLGYAFYRGADCCALVYDITNPDSFDHLDRWRDGFIEHAGPEDVNNFPFVLLGNKVDKENERRVNAQKGEAWCKDHHNIPFFETSATENVSVGQAFEEMAKMAMKRESQNQIVMPTSLGSAQGAITLSAGDDKKRGQTQVQNKANCKC